MSRAQRLTFLVLAVLVLVVAIVLIGPSDDAAEQTSETTPTPTATATPAEPESTPTPTPTPTLDPGPLLVAGKVARIDVHKGDRVRLRARSDTPDEIHVHGYDLSKDVPAGRTTSMSFVADIEGIFEIEFEGSHTQVAELRVEP